MYECSDPERHQTFTKYSSIESIETFRFDEYRYSVIYLSGAMIQGVLLRDDNLLTIRNDRLYETPTLEQIISIVARGRRLHFMA